MYEEHVLKVIINSKYLVAFTGAGISAESGIPTFRGKDGLWSKYDPTKLASPWGFQENPKLVWEWYKWRMSMIMNAKPNPAHYTLALLEKMHILKSIITQNIDGLHQKAGSLNVIEIHGNIWKVKCTVCNYRSRLIEPPESVPPHCPKCGAILRPDVVWFGEPLPEDEWSRAIGEASRCDVMLVIGTSGVVMPAALIPNIAKSKGAIIVEINPETTPISEIADIKVPEPAGVFFSKIKSLLRTFQ